MVAHRLRRWPSIKHKPTLVECPFFLENNCRCSLLRQSNDVMRKLCTAPLQNYSHFCGSILANRRNWLNVGFIMAHRLRRWPTINPALSQVFVLAGTLRNPCHADKSGGEIVAILTFYWDFVDLYLGTLILHPFSTRKFMLLVSGDVKLYLVFSCFYSHAFHFL